jgi:hypothetical protein
MANLPAQIKRAFLQSLFDLVQDGTATELLATGETDAAIPDLLAALKAFQKMQFGALSTGKSSIGSTGFAHGTQWQGYQLLRAFNPEEVFSLAQELREVYTDARARLVAAGDATPADPAVVAEMFDDDRMCGATVTRPDFSTMRLGVQ